MMKKKIQKYVVVRTLIGDNYGLVKKGTHGFLGTFCDLSPFSRKDAYSIQKKLNSGKYRITWGGEIRRRDDNIINMIKEFL